MSDDYPGPLIETKEKEINLNKLPCIQKEIKGEDNTIYNLKIYKTNKSIIFIIIQNDILNYESEYSLQQFFEINNFFKSFSSIQDIYTNFFDKLENKEILILENEYKLILKFKFNYIREIKEIIFDFDINIKNRVLKISNKIKEIEKINIKLKEINKEIEEQKIKLNEQIKIIKNNKNEINNINGQKLEDIKKNIKENIKEIKDNENKEKSKLDNLSKKIEETKKFM